MRGNTMQIVDAMMGKGKTSWAIQQMNEDSANKYVYITPFLDEVARVKESCRDRKFKDPVNFGKGKQHSLHQLLLNGDNIVSTHALFRDSTETTKKLIESNDYILILDEVMDVIEQVHLKKNDIELMMSENLITIKNGYVIWNPEKLEYDSRYNDIKNMALNHTLLFVNNTVLMWNFPVEVFKSFKEVYILTYKFHSQIQRYYYDLHSVDYKYNTITKDGDKYALTEVNRQSHVNDIDRIKEISKLINILDHPKLNSIGENEFALSNSWFKKKDNTFMIAMLQKNVSNYFKNIRKAKSNDVLWTTFKDYKGKLSGAGYTKGFIACNCRATNEYGDKHNLAYCLNVFLNPIVSQFFIDKGVVIDEEGYALSEMLQWVWRSAIRNGEEIDVYIPSLRMRDLLERYLQA